ncbi:MAG: hypothetical protein WC679_03635 [Bacteroidales bacterium]|jgi:hypothetical protein
MKHIFKITTLVLICLFLQNSVFAREYIGKVNKTSTSTKADGGVERCRRAQGSAELSINNVRARINTGGNMWYDGNTAKYYVPKDGSSTAMFCAALWIGGQDENKQLRVAALRFGQDGDDFWPGPLTVDKNASVNKSVCEKWDKHFRITKAEVQAFVAGCKKNEATGQVISGPTDQSLITDAIKNWPAHPDNYAELKQTKYLAPFKDVDGDGEYNYTKGDYPYYDFNGDLCPVVAKQSGQKYNPIRTMEDSIGTGGEPVTGGILVDQVLKGDETLWWVFNDKGNSHTESKSANPIGLEIRAQAFAFSMNDEINNMTFYSYEIINRSTFTLQNTYFSQWVDPDLGYAQDDYVGCDVKRGLGYCYNGKATDGPGTGAYSGNPPAIGIDFFQGPYLDADGLDNPKVYIDLALADASGKELLKKYLKKDANGNPIEGNYDTLLITANASEFENFWYDPNDKITNGANINGVNFGNGIIDDERFGMRRFVYYENSSHTTKGEPDKATDYYNYLRGMWKTGVNMTFGADGTSGTINCDFMFPGTTDTWNWGTKGIVPTVTDTRGWTEESSGNAPGDRRFMQSAGPFELKPGAINYITVGIPFAQAASGGPYASVTLLRQIDDKCQALFDNCFNILEGPDAPDLTIKELDRELILYLTNDSPSSNNINEAFDKIDVSIPKSYDITRDTIYDNTVHTLITSTVEYDRHYKFEGYQIFQLKDATVSVTDIYDEDKARLVGQCDIKNFDVNQNNQPISKLINYNKDNNIGGLVPQVMVDGLNSGIQHTFKVTEDKFASTNDKTIVNNKKYYYVAVAYAYNNFKPYNPEDVTKIDGQKETYLASRKTGFGNSITSIIAIPHQLEPEQNGTLVQSSYGICPEIKRIEGNGNGGMVLNFQTSTLEKIMGKANEEPVGVSYVTDLLYKENYGPLNIKVIDPIKLRQGSYTIKIIKSDTSDNLMYATWKLQNIDTTQPLYTTTVNGASTSIYSITSDRTIGDINEQIIFPLGISISLTNPNQTVTPLYISNDLYSKQKKVFGGDLDEGTALYSSIVAKDPNKTWLFGITDNDAKDYLNWIKSGSKSASEAIRRDPFSSDENLFDYLGQDYYYSIGKLVWNSANNKFDTIFYDYPIDKDADYEGVGSGWWTPYRLTSLYTNYGGTILPHPGFSYYHFSSESSPADVTKLRLDPSFVYSTTSNDMSNLSSVDIVFTSDKTKWTRCPVIEMGDDPNQTEGNAKRFQLRRHASVDKNGDNAGDGTQGWGWFPGYAINLETGQRLNMMFGENSQLGVGQPGNGRDLIWNPTSTTQDGGGYVFGGMHYIYVLGASQYTLYTPNNLEPNLNTRLVYPKSYYDKDENGNMDMGTWAYNKLRKLDNLVLTNTSPYGNDYKNTNLTEAMEVFGSAMWVGMPLATAFNSDPKAEIPTDVTVSLRVRQPYKINYINNENGSAANPQNNNYPMYEFSITKDIATSTGNIELAKSALDQITVVPNPYFASSTYENDQVQNLVKICNLPPDCHITIYSVDGTVIRKLRGPSKSLVSGTGTALTSVDWDLKNHKGLPISGGAYIIHIKADGVGEKIIKWFGALRPIDLNSFQ